MGTDTGTTSVSQLVYIPDANDVDAYHLEIRSIFMGLLGAPLSAVKVTGPTNTHYHQVIVEDIQPDVDVASALVEIDIALAESSVLPHGTTFATQGITNHSILHHLTL